MKRNSDLLYIFYYYVKLNVTKHFKKQFVGRVFCYRVKLTGNKTRSQERTFSQSFCYCVKSTNNKTGRLIAT